MKKINFGYFVLAFVIFAVLLSSYWYPRTRDEFFYLPDLKINLFKEFHLSYIYGNPRFGQFFANLVGRNLIFKPIFNLLLILSYVSAIFLFIFRRLPKINTQQDIWKFLIISSVFIFLINVFGEMFYYVPFNTNYTFTHIFYLLYLFLISEYYFYENNLLKNHNKIYFPVFIGAFFMGWCNEHVPPVLLGGSFLLAFLYFIKNKKLPNFKIISLNIPIIIGYLVLFFAPANKIKFKATGAKQYGFQISEYLKHWLSIFKTYYYYNFELLLVLIVTIVFILFNFNKISKILKFRLLFYFLLSTLTLAIVAYSPLQGTRLLLFTNSLWIIIILLIGKEFVKKDYSLLKWVTSAFLLIFFSFSVYVTYKAQENYQKIMSEIKFKSERNKNVVLDESFNYTKDFPFSRKILLENGTSYIDDKPEEQNSIKNILKSYFGINSISVKKEIK